MKLYKSDYFLFFLILVISIFFVSDLFLFSGRPATFDSNFHITNIAQFSKIIGQGEVPVIWMNNFANYGIPMGIFAHQLTSYLGGVIIFLIHDPVLSYNLLVFIAIFLSNIFLYLFLRLYFSQLASFLGTFIFSFTPYHVFNIYVRGAMPEVFSGIFLPLILIAFYLFIVKKKTYSLFLITLFIAGLTLNHPMMLIVYSLFFIPYLFFLLITSSLSITSRIKVLIAASFSMMLGLLICSYYIIPLFFEIKYFYYGLIKNHITANSYLSILNFLDPRWYYFTKSEIFPRGHIVMFGLAESTVLILGFLYIFIERFIQKTQENTQVLLFALATAALLIFFTTKYSDIFFQHLFFLNDIQFPWRFLSGLIFLPPIVASYLYDRFPKKIIIVMFVIAVVCFSFPQLYGKNYNIYSSGSYLYSKENAHSVLMNTIWTGKSEDYPDKNKQGEIIDGQGKIIKQTLKNSSRSYQIDAKTPLQMVDRTFYFPGWNVYIDGVKTGIQFQNPNYRGVITYNVPTGNHLVSLIFQDTKIRFLGKILSIVFLLIFIVLFFLKEKINRALNIFQA